MKDNNMDNQAKAPEILEIKSTQEKIVPKFCTNINIGLLKNKNVVLTMAYSEGKDSVALIERIVIDLEHAKSLNDILSKLLKESENVA